MKPVTALAALPSACTHFAEGEQETPSNPFTCAGCQIAKQIGRAQGGRRNGILISSKGEHLKTAFSVSTLLVIFRGAAVPLLLIPNLFLFIPKERNVFILAAIESNFRGHFLFPSSACSGRNLYSPHTVSGHESNL